MSFIKKLKEEDIISSYNFARNSDFVFAEVLTREQFTKLDTKNLIVVQEDDSKVLYINKNICLNENDIIFCNTYFVKELFKILVQFRELKNLKLITNQTDHSINEKLFKLKPSNISEWYSINVSINASGLFPIPLGLSNNYSPKNLNRTHFSNLKNEIFKSNKIYINFKENINYIKRSKVLKFFKDKEFVITAQPDLPLDKYLNDLQEFKFTLAPNGNGIDTHRVWESLYAGSVPIVEKHKSFETLDDLNALRVNNFYEINENIIKNYEDKKQNNEKLNIKYWIKKIKSNSIDFEKQYSTTLSDDEIKNISKKYFGDLKRESYIKYIATLRRKILRKIFN